LVSKAKDLTSEAEDFTCKAKTKVKDVLTTKICMIMLLFDLSSGNSQAPFSLIISQLLSYNSISVQILTINMTRGKLTGYT